jgi:hypothetical protein
MDITAAPMIQSIRLNHQALVVNCDLIKYQGSWASAR